MNRPITPPLPLIPPLKAGDRLTRDEFERRYHAMPDLKEAELIEGVVYMPSPVRYRHHSGPHGQLVTWLGVYQSLTPGVALADNTTVRLDVNNEPQPDALLFIEPAGSGQAIVSHDDYIVGAPELVAEVAASSIDIDLGPKKEAYRRNGVKEYIVWHVPEQQIDWYVLRDDEYVSLSPESDGLLKSGVFAGLWLDAAALVRGDLARVLAVVQQGAATGEHAAFVARLAGSAN